MNFWEFLDRNATGIGLLVLAAMLAATWCVLFILEK
jgi:hypothetical protein